MLTVLIFSLEGSHPKIQLSRASNLKSFVSHCRFDERISTFAEQKFRRDGIEVLTGCRVLSVTESSINIKHKSTKELSSVSHGMVVWSTGVGTRPVVMDFMEKVGQVCFLLGLTRISHLLLV